jgi:hypothetical protein
LLAYRAHFSLSGEIFDKPLTDSSFSEYIEEDVIHESLEETEIIDEQIEEIYEDEEIIQNVEEEIYLEALEAETETEETIFQDEESFKKLDKTEDEKYFRFQCHICDEPEFQNMRSLTNHCKSIHDALPLVKCCSENCNSVLSTWRRLLIHKEKHFPSETSSKFRCDSCNR